MFGRLLLFCLIPSLLLAQEDDVLRTDKVTIAALNHSGQPIRMGPAFLYNETTIICSYADVRGASSIRVEWSGESVETKKIISYSESMDIAVFATSEEIPVETPVGSSSTLALGDTVSYWIPSEDRWTITKGAVHQILDTGRGYNLILIESSSYTTRSTPLYDADKKIVGWLQGKRAIPIETIAEFAEKEAAGMTIEDLKKRAGPPWKFSKPLPANGKLSVSALKTVSGPSSYSFKVNLPEDWKAKVSDGGGRFLVRYENQGVCVEIRATSLGDDDLVSALEEIESTVFADFLRSELIPYSTDALTGFLALYEDSDSMHPHSLQVFYTASAQNLYLLSISYPENREEEVNPLIEQIFSSFRM